jgi:hypothetical protein
VVGAATVPSCATLRCLALEVTFGNPKRGCSPVRGKRGWISGLTHGCGNASPLLGVGGARGLDMVLRRIEFDVNRHSSPAKAA